MLKLNEELRPHGVHLSRRPGVVPVLARRRAHRHERLVADRRPLRPHARPRDLVRDRAADRRDHPRRRRRRHARSASRRAATSSSTCSWATRGRSGIVTEATLELVKRPEAEFSAFFAYRDYMDAWRATAELARSGVATLAGVVLFDEWKLAYLRRDDEAYIPQPDWVKGVVACAAYGNEDEVRVGAKRLLRIGQGDRRHATSATRSRRATGRRATTATRRRCTAARANGQVALMSWHCEDAAIPTVELPAVREKWHAIARRPPRALRHVRRLGDVRLHQRRRTSRGATTSPRSTSASGR